MNRMFYLIRHQHVDENTASKETSYSRYSMHSIACNKRNRPRKLSIKHLFPGVSVKVFPPKN